VLSFVSPVRMGWQIEDVIVIGERIMGRRWKRGEERAYIGSGRMVFVGLAGMYPVQT